MSVEIFTKQRFEQSLPVNKTTGTALWVSAGLQLGEYTYKIPVNDVCSIEVRSSVRSNGVSASTGKDSIRAWLVGPDGKPVGSKVQSYVTRTAGWDTRMVDMLRKLYVMGRLVVKCHRCTKVVQILKVKKEGPNKGALFTKCDCPNSFKWVTV